MIVRSCAGVRTALYAFAAAATIGCATVLPPTEEPKPREEPAPAITSARDLVREMHDRWAGNWYRTLRFEQANTFYTQSGREEKSRWVENLSVPGRLRIDFHPLTSKSGLLILNNRVTTFDNGRRMGTRRSIQAILTLTADVYAIPAAITIRRLDSLGIDMNKLHQTRLNRRRVYVMGAEEGDLASTQAWVDAERLLLVRFIQADKRAERTVVTDTQVGGYREIDGFLVAHEFTSSRDGRPYFKEEYENVRVNEPIPAAIFDPSRWSAVQPDAVSP